jgi:hypothetical protein
MGDQVPKPEALNINGYPAAGLNDNYGGLCSFDCNLGYCPDTACATVSAPLTTPTVSPFTPPACTGGEGPDPFPGLCSYACTFGFCPRNICTCTSQGALVDTPPITEQVTANAADNGYEDHGLCDFACQRGYCPYPCVKSDRPGSGPAVYIDPEIWSDPTPTVSCIPPCVIVLPPVTLSTPTTLEFPPLVTTLTERWNNRSSTTSALTFTFPPVVTTVIPVFNINITQTGVSGVTYTVTPSILPSASTTIYPPATGTGTSSLTPIVVWVTSTPQGTSTYPTLTSVPTQVVVASGGPPGPTCALAGGCGGSECRILCNSCGILGCGGICLGCGPSICIGCGPDGQSGGSGHSDCIGAGCDDGDPDDDCGNPVTATICTLVVSSTQVLTTPTTSWSTTTRTHCDTTVGCDVEGATTTSTMTTSAPPADPTYNPTQYYDAYDGGDYTAKQALFTSILAWYSSYTENVDTPRSTSTPSLPLGANAYYWYKWNCDSSSSYRVGKPGDGHCASRGNLVDLESRTEMNATYNICGGSRKVVDKTNIVGTDGFRLALSSGGWCDPTYEDANIPCPGTEGGTCMIWSYTPCTDVDGSACKVAAIYTCTDSC